MNTIEEEGYERLQALRGDFVEANFWAEIDFIRGFTAVRCGSLPRSIHEERFWSMEFAAVTAAELNIAVYPSGLNAASLMAASNGLGSDSSDKLMRLWAKHRSGEERVPLPAGIVMRAPADENSLVSFLAKPELFLSVPTLTSAVAHVFGTADADPNLGVRGSILLAEPFVTWIWSHFEEQLSTKWWRQILLSTDWDDREAYRVFKDLTVRFCVRGGDKGTDLCEQGN